MMAAIKNAINANAFLHASDIVCDVGLKTTISNMPIITIIKTSLSLKFIFLLFSILVTRYLNKLEKGEELVVILVTETTASPCALGTTIQIFKEM